MQKIEWLIALIVSVCFACLSVNDVVVPVITEAVRTVPTLTNVPTAAAGLDMFVATRPAAARSCARVIADEALHLRNGDSYTALHLEFLRAGDVVELVTKTDPDWWQVRKDDIVGFARAKYLEEVECVK